jgi:hypothetical protein
VRALIALAILGLAGAGAQQGDTGQNPAAQKVRDHLRNISATSREELLRDVAALAQGGLDAGNTDLAKLVDDLLHSLAGKTPAVALAGNVEGDLETVLHPGGGSARQTRGAASDFVSQLKACGVESTQAELVGADLRRFLPVSQASDVSDAPAHQFRFALPAAPKYDKFVLVEDFETGSDIFRTWYQPGWSTGIVATYDSQNKGSGTYGLTISNNQTPDKISSMAKIPKPYQNIEGMNALRMWIKPYEMDGTKGSVSTGFIDGSKEIWQVDLPDMLSGTEPYILQVRLADFRRVLRRNNGRIDLENQDFAFWMSGTYKFTVDDIMFVHDPSVPEFVPITIQ